MPSARVRRQVETLLDDAEAAASKRDWLAVRDCAEAGLRVGPENEDAQHLLRLAGIPAADGADGSNATHPTAVVASPTVPNADAVAPEPAAQPTSFANGRYQLKKFLGEGGKEEGLPCSRHDPRPRCRVRIDQDRRPRRSVARAHHPRGPGHGPTPRPPAHRAHLRLGRRNGPDLGGHPG